VNIVKYELGLLKFIHQRRLNATVDAITPGM